MAKRGPYRKSGTAMTGAERAAKFRAKKNEFEVGEVENYARRESCRDDLVRFGLVYCSHLLKHEPSELMTKSLIRPLENVIRYGGQQVCLFPRGTGKTTWFKIAIVWALVYGHKRFIMTVAATSQHAKNILNQVADVFTMSDAMLEDFPALSAPVRALNNNWRKASSQMYHGQPTRIQNSEGYFVLPEIFDDHTGALLESAAGACVYTAGIHGAIRGVARGSERPDLILFDDPQTRKEAESRQQSDKLESLILNDALGCFGNTSIVSALMSVTPIKHGDIATRFSSRKLHAEWGLSKQAYLIQKSERFDALLPGFKAAYQEDVEITDRAAREGHAVDLSSRWRLSTEFYEEHREEYAGTEVVDPLNFADGEVDAIHHLLKVMCRFSDLSDFAAEYQMDVQQITEGEPVTVEEVMSATNGAPRYLLPNGTTDCVAFCDVNIQKGSGLRYAVVAFGPGRVAAVIDYGSFPKDGSPLVPPNSTPAERQTRIDVGIKAVVHHLITTPYTLELNGERVIPSALAVDAGYEPDQVHKTVNWVGNNVRLRGMSVMCSLGRGWKQYRRFRKGEEREGVVKDHVYSGGTIKKEGVGEKQRLYIRKYLGIQTDYWREIAQKSFRRRPLQQGSVSLFGNDPRAHYDFALETTYEQLIQTYRDTATGRMAWEWNNEKKGHNHYGDCLVGCFALASWKDLYRATKEAEPTLIQGDWFTEFGVEALEVKGAPSLIPADPSAGRAPTARPAPVSSAPRARPAGRPKTRPAPIFKPYKFRRK